MMNSLTALDVTKCPELMYLNCGGNPLSTLDVTNCPKLTYLYCHNNSLSVLDVTKCTELTVLDCSNNSLFDLNLKNCSKLEYLEGYNQNPVLPVVKVQNAKLCIKNPITDFGIGMETGIDNISHNGTYEDGNITWDVQGEKGEVTFDFTTISTFSGTATQPWTKK